MKKAFYTSADSALTDELWTQALSNLKKDGVQAPDINDKINSIVNNNNSSSSKKFATVQDKLKEMIQRSGFEQFQKSQVKVSNAKKVSASSPEETLKNQIKMFVVCPSCKSTIDNVCSSSKGLLPILSIIGRVKDIHGKDVVDQSLWTDPKFLTYIANKNLQCKVNTGEKEYTNLGKIEYSDEQDPTSGDVFSGMESNK